MDYLEYDSERIGFYPGIGFSYILVRIWEDSVTHLLVTGSLILLLVNSTGVNCPFKTLWEKLPVQLKLHGESEIICISEIAWKLSEIAW